jgi:putative transcriptional regulator
MKISIKKQLKAKGISRYELAKRIGVTYPTITHIYKEDSTSIHLEILEALCIELDCSPSDILISDNINTKTITSDNKKDILTSRLNTFVKYLDKIISTENNKTPLSNIDAIRQHSYCLGLEMAKSAIINILNDKDFDYIADSYNTNKNDHEEL